MATTTETKPRKPPKLFSVSGSADGITTTLTDAANKRLLEASGVLDALSHCGQQFPRADALAAALDAFIANPTAKD